MLQRERAGREAEAEPGIDAERNLLGRRADQLRRQPARFGHASEDVAIGQLKRSGALAIEGFQRQAGSLRQRADAGVVQVDGVCRSRGIRCGGARRCRIRGRVPVSLLTSHLSLLSLGSYASRSASPTRLKPSTADSDGQPGGKRDPGSDPQEVAPIGHHGPPARGRRLRSQSHEGEGGLCHDGPGDAQGSRDDHLGAHVGQQVAEKYPAIPRAQGPGGEHELRAAENQDLAPDQPGHASPAD